MGLGLLALACLVGAALAGPFQRQPQCVTHCPTQSNEKFSYEPGRKYVYDYEGVNHVVVAGQRKQRAQISGQVEIHVKTRCEMVMKMKNIRLEQKATEAERADLMRKLEIPLVFAFQDGQIDHVCPSSQESHQSQNIKKGVLSTFINTMDKLEESQQVKEVDSLGTCVTTYTVQNSQPTLIKKEKDLKSCTNRHSAITSFMTNQYESPQSDIHSLPIFPQDKLSCMQTIERGVLKSCKCKELSTIRPFGHQDSIVEFEGEVDLRLSTVQAAESVSLHPLGEKNPLLYNLEEEKFVKDNAREVEEQLKEMCSKNVGTIDISVSQDFITLVRAVKRLPYDALQSLYSSLESGRLCSSKKLTDLFLDTLPMAGNDAAIRLMVNVLVQQKISGLKAKLWAASLALVPHPSHEAIAAVVPLLKEQKSASVFLGVSAMVYRYCTRTSCHDSDSVKEIVSTLNQVLGRQCSNDKENEVLAVLKAFGNMGQHLQAEETILACAKNSDKSIRLRLAAIDAFRRIDKKRPDELLKLYTDSQEHYEVRIAALSSVLRQADQQQIQTIKEVAEREADEQVSAYTASLISNFNETSSPLKRHVRQLLNEIQVHPPKVGYWENSKNLELSSFSETLNLGGSVESDIIHAPHSKIPRSVYTRLDLDLFDKHVNIFEVGLRAEGLEAAFKKLIGFQEEKKQKSSWRFLSSSNDIDEEDHVEASFFFRAMNTEILDLSFKDLTGIGEMLKVADILNKISQEKSADFSHSFLFLNSKLIIPSVTGRSYSFGLTGSATVGLTASSKADIVNIMSKPKNCDVHGHFQPSVNAEIAATVGIHSDQARPDVKIVTRLHSESDIEATFRIQDGHLGLLRVNLPSEKIALTRISSEVIEIDAHHQERRVYENMQTKVDACFEKLEKPLGISVCGKWQVPRPFISKTFPFVKGVGLVEFAIKKSDPGMKGFEFAIEVPKHKSQVMKYTASLDSPGSRVNRKFLADLEIRMPSREEKQLSLQLQSPFQSVKASASGSFKWRHDLIESSLDIEAGSSHRYSIRAASPVSESASQKTFKPSIQISSPSFQEFKVDGTLSITKGRKEQIAFDLKSNQPSQKPWLIQGTVVKDSKSSDWKLSSDITLKTPPINLHIRSSTDKQSKQAETISTAFVIDYQKGRSQRQTVKLAGKLQRSSSKISSTAQFETTEFPSSNFVLNWDMQGKLKESLKNDINFKYGKTPEHQFIHILQSSKMYDSQPSECRIAIKAPQFDIDSGISITHDMQSKSKIHTDVDLRYKKDKHVKAKLHLDNISQKPLKLKIKAEIQTPSKRMMYQDELEEIAPNMYKGNAVVEWRQGRKAELQYTYKQLSERSKWHHEIESTLRLPQSRSPIKNKVSIQMSQDIVGIESRLTLDRSSDYSFNAHLHKKGISHVSLQTPKVEGNLKIVNDNDKKAADLDLKLNLFRQSRHIIASAGLGLGSQKKLEVEILLDADSNPNSKFSFQSVIEKLPRNQCSNSLKLQISDKIDIEISVSGDHGIYGRKEASIKASIFNQEPIELAIRHEMRPTSLDTVIRISKNEKQKLELTAGGKYLRNGREVELSTATSVKSLDNSFQTKKWSSTVTLSRSGSSTHLKSNARLEWSSSKVYESELNFNLEPNVVLLKANLNTPHLKFEKQSVSFSFQISESLISSSATVELANGESISVSSETEKKSTGFRSSLTVSSPFDAVKDVKLLVSWEKQEPEKSLKLSMDANGERVADADLSITSSSRSTELKGHVKSVLTPDFSAQVSMERRRQSFKYNIQIMKDSASLMSATLSKQASNQEFSYALETTSYEKTLVSLKLVKEISSQSTKYSLKAQGSFPELSFNIESTQNEKNALNVVIEACQGTRGKTCYSAKAYHKVLANEENYRYYRKLTFDVEKSSQNGSPQLLTNVNILASIKGNDYREKFIVDTDGKKLGYEFRLHRRDDEQDHCSMDSHIFLPHRTIRARGSALHNHKSVLLDFEIIPNTAEPSRKLGFELKREKDNQKTEGYVKMSYPGMRTPLQLSGHIENEGRFPVGGKLKLDSSSIGGKVWHFEILPEQISRQRERKAITYKLYSEDQTFKVSGKLMKRVTQEESEFSYTWTWQTPEGHKEGKVSMQLLQKRNGKPQVVQVELLYPSGSSKLSSEIVWGSRLPSRMHLNFESNSQSFFDIDVRADRSCLWVEQSIKSRKYMEHEVCFGKVEEKKVKLFSVKSLYQKRPSFTFFIEVDPEHPQLANINISWDKRNLRLAQNEARQLLSELQSRYVSDADFSSYQRWLQDAYNNYCQALRDAQRMLESTIRRHFGRFIEEAHFKISALWNHLARYLPVESIKSEIIQPITRFIRCIYDKSVELYTTRLPDAFRDIWGITKKNVIECLKTYCDKDSFCYGWDTILENFEIEQVKNVASRKVRNFKRSLATSYERALPEVRRCIQRMCESAQRYWQSVFGGSFAESWAKYFEQLQHFLQEKFSKALESILEWLGNILQQAEEDEDFQVIQSLMQEGKEKVMSTWEHRRELLTPLRNSLEEFPKNWIKEKMHFQKFSPKEGTIQLQLHHPLRSMHIQVLRNAMVALKNKVLS